MTESRRSSAPKSLNGSYPQLWKMAAKRLAEIRAEKQLQALRKIQEVVKPYTPHRSSPKQESFLQLDAEEAFYGGAGGGGKTDALINAALLYVDVPNYSAGLFRRTKEDMRKPGAILDRARKWFTGTAARWDADIHGFRFPSGATIHFGYAASRQEVEDRYQGSEFQYVGVDELPQWEEVVYKYLFSRLRRLKGFPVPVRMRGAGNPGGRGAAWARARFIDHARHVVTGALYRDCFAARKRGEAIPEPPYFESPPSSEAVDLARQLNRKPQGAFFVPAFAEDNPGLDREEYQVALLKLDAVTKAQIRDGDWWTVGGGKLFRPEWFRYIEVAPKLARVVRTWDLAATKEEKNKDPDWSACVKQGLEVREGGAHGVVILHGARTREEPGGVEAFVKGIAQADGRRVPIWIEEEPGSAGKNNTHNYASKVLPGWQVHGLRKTGPKLEYWRPLSADAQNGMVSLLVGEWNAEFVQELCDLTTDDSHSHDDYADAAGTGRSILLEESGLQRLRKWDSSAWAKHLR